MPKLRESKHLNDWRAQKLSDWIEDTGRKVGWVAQQLDCSRAWVSYILNGRYPVSDSLAEKIENKLGIGMGIGEDF
jgi:plasmid maintenance system antidote protein VapI